MGAYDYYAPGQYNFRCQECFKKLKAGDAMLRWDNYWVGPECWEIRNPQDYQRGIPDNQNPPWSTGDPPPLFISGVPASPQQALTGPTLLLDNYLLGSKLLG